MKELATFVNRFSKVLTNAGIKIFGKQTVNNYKYPATKFLCGNKFFKDLFPPKLTTGYLELTNKCNLRCKMCIYTKLQEKTGYMSKELFKNCIKQFSKMKLSNLYLHFGGESLLHPDFNQLLRYAIHYRDNGNIGNIGWIDNGMLLNQSLADLIIELKVDLIGISIDGVGKVNDEIRCGSNYSIIKKNVKYLVENRGKEKKPQVYLSMCDYGKTEEQIIDVYREWISTVDSITLIPSILPNNTVANKTSISGKHKLVEPPSYCYFPFETIAVSWDGKITGCCSDYSFKMDLGNSSIFNLKKIWNNSNFQTWRKNLIENTFSTGSPCNGCEFWKINFQPKVESSLDGKAEIKYGYIYRTIKQTCKT